MCKFARMIASLKTFVTILSFCICSELYAQNALKGVLIDDSKIPLAGAVLQWKSQTYHAVTDEQGAFNILRADLDSILVINYVGFKTKEIAVAPDPENFHRLKRKHRFATGGSKGQTK